MGLVAILKSFFNSETVGGALVSEVEADTGGGANITGRHYSAPGEDAQPCDTDYVAMMKTEGEGRYVAVGYLDPINEAKSGKGGKRIYGRDPDTCAPVVELWLKNDGSATMSNAAGSFELKQNGDIVLNNVTIKPDGSIIVGGVNLTTHFHTQPTDGGGDTELPTATPSST